MRLDPPLQPVENGAQPQIVFKILERCLHLRQLHIDAWTVDQEARYLESLSPREVFHVAVDVARGIVGFQSLDLWSPLLTSMAHVGQMGTFLLREWRGQGVGRQLWSATESFAREAGYRKLAIQVRGSNVVAQAFYRHLGFRKCGRLTSQVMIDGVEDDEVLMEFFC